MLPPIPDIIDNKTSDIAPMFEGIVESGASVQLISSLNGRICSAAEGRSGNLLVSSTNLDFGSHNITAKAAHSSGNESIKSAAVVIVINHNPSITGTPTIYSTPKVGKVLLLTDTGTKDIDTGDSVTPSCQWLRDDSIIWGATSESYKLVLVDANTSITSGVDAKGGLPWMVFNDGPYFTSQITTF